jgi:hypothetical protein
MEKFTLAQLEDMRSKLADKESYEKTPINVANLRALIEQAKGNV